jgi:hypothetical protein
MVLAGSCRTWLHETQPYIVGRKVVKVARSVFFMALFGAVTMRAADMIQKSPPSVDDGAIPQSVNETNFEALFTNSPFTRSLGVSDSIILTGIAHIEGDVFATLLDTETMQSQVVSKAANLQGWQLVGVSGNPAESRTWAAKIQVAGGQVISVRYQKPPTKSTRSSSGSSGSSNSSGSNLPPLSTSQIAEAKDAAVNYREGFSSDGYPRQPPAEMVAKLSRLSVSQREDINRQMLGWRNKGLGLDERRKIYEDLVDRSMQGRR